MPTSPAKKASPKLDGLPRGLAILHDPVHNKGLAFTRAEREALGLTGLLPPAVLTQEQQVARILENLQKAGNDLERYIQLHDLGDRSERLFYRVVMDNLEYTLPILYTPTVGAACQQFGHIYRRPRGIYITRHDRGRVREILSHWPRRDVRIIVITDGERILGLGDLGANGMGIPVGKLALYSACAGLAPEHCLPVMFDTGTENQALRDDPLYLGERAPRLRGEAYDGLLDEFMQAVEANFPGCLVQFEDFANINAFRLLEKYRERYCVFNDDIQGTGSVALAGVISSMRITGGRISDQRFLFLGAGEAATGIADMLVRAMIEEGLTEDAAKARIWLFDSHGLIVSSRTGLQHHKARYAHPHPQETDFLAALKALKPTAIMGASGQPGVFSKEVLETMARLNKNPIVFPLSNPTSKAECTAEAAFTLTEGRVAFASGSPFPPVKVGGKTYIPGQGNNAYIFPGVGLGVIASKSRHVTDEMFFAAAKTLAGLVDADDIDHGRTYPPFTRIRDVSLDIAVAVAELAYRDGLARVPRPKDLRGAIAALRYDPRYPTFA